MKTATVILRAATAGDREFLYRVYASTRAEELAATDWSDEQKAVFLRQQFDVQDAHYRTYEGASFQVIVSDNENAGRLYIHRRAREIRVMDIALLPDFRARGIGAHILQDVQREAARDGSCVTVHVEKFNAARALYERLGFIEAGDAGVYLLLRWEP
jgi:ribosomal protein S18 acetylase RimI-like enzyme